MARLKRFWWAAILLLAFSIWFYFMLPNTLFEVPYSTAIVARDGNLLGAQVADDGQWRFPELDTVPDKYATALRYFEDEHFYQHFGVRIPSLLRAARDNIKARKIISGGSTITMQVVRLSRTGAPRTFLGKAYEILLAVRLECAYSKEEIMTLHAAHAPFGGNTVGLPAATWRYFQRAPDDISWGEAALLAVLPNSPGLIHPGKNRNRLIAKRNFLLDKLKTKGVIDAQTAELAKAEPIPEAPAPLPSLAPELLTRCINGENKGEFIQTTIHTSLQQRSREIAGAHVQRLTHNGIHNIAALVADVKTGQVLVYVGNAPNPESKGHGEQIDLITAPRSTGSILKPFLYAAMLQEGAMLPASLQPDVPTYFKNFVPKNFINIYDGAVPADKALIRSLNIPFVYMLRDYRYEKFHQLLKDLGMSTLHQPPDHYGLSLILGGAEATLWDLTGMYAGLGRALYTDQNSFSNLRFTHGESPQSSSEKKVLDKASVWLTLNALAEVQRPLAENSWRLFDNSRKIAWKTGTSFGHRDAWAIGVTPEYVVGVWVGNAHGSGRPGLTGVEVAAPILFDLFKILPETSWFTQPASEMITVRVCSHSGFKAGPHCEVIKTTYVSKKGQISTECRFHQTIHLDETGNYRADSECESVSKLRQKKWFVLPPLQEYYFLTRNPRYKKLPPWKHGCMKTLDAVMELIYPRSTSKVFLPVTLDGTKSPIIMEVAHRVPESTIFWHLNESYLGSTRGQHQMIAMPDTGNQRLVLIDENGSSLIHCFEILSN